MMNTAAVAGPFPFPFAIAEPTSTVYDRAVWRVVEQVSRQAHRACQANRRKDPRVPYSQILEITPVRLSQEAQHVLGSPQLRAQRNGRGNGSADAALAIGQMLQTIDVPLEAIGRALGPRGVDFYHNPPIPSRYVLVRFEELPDACPLLLDVRWSRFLRHGWYLSGGRFLCAADMAADAGACRSPDEQTAS